MTKSIYPFLLVFVLGLKAHGQATSATRLASMRIELENSEYIANISQIPVAIKKGGFFRELRIACSPYCKTPTYYEEKIDDMPLGMFRASDGDRLLITTWTAGTSYVVRIYRLLDGNIKKVFDVHSLETPQFIGSESDGLKIITVISPEPGGPAAGGVKTTWAWSSGSFSIEKAGAR